MAFKKSGPTSQPILHSVSELEALSTERQSAVEKLCKYCMHIMLMPKYLGKNLKTGICNHLNKRINTFLPELDGILIGYGKLYLSRNQGSLMNDSAGVHIKVVADFYVFRPKPNTIIKGVVSRKSLGHVSVMVHNALNIACYCPSNLAAEAWCGQRVEDGQSVKVLLTKTDIKHGLPFMEGNLLGESIFPSNGDAATETETVNVKTELDEVEEKRSNDSGIESCTKDSKKKVKKSKKRKLEEPTELLEPKKEIKEEIVTKSKSKKRKMQ